MEARQGSALLAARGALWAFGLFIFAPSVVVTDAQAVWVWTVGVVVLIALAALVRHLSERERRTGMTTTVR